MDTSPFAKLPPELRDYIYEFALTHDEELTIDIIDYWKKDNYRQRINPVIGPRHALSLTKTCKQIRAETGLMLYKLNTFTVLHPPATLPHVLWRSRHMCSMVLDYGELDHKLWPRRYFMNKQSRRITCMGTGDRDASIIVRYVLVCSRSRGLFEKLVVEIDNKTDVVTSIKGVRRKETDSDWAESEDVLEQARLLGFGP